MMSDATPPEPGPHLNSGFAGAVGGFSSRARSASPAFDPAFRSWSASACVSVFAAGRLVLPAPACARVSVLLSLNFQSEWKRPCFDVTFSQIARASSDATISLSLSHSPQLGSFSATTRSSVQAAKSLMMVTPLWKTYRATRRGYIVYCNLFQSGSTRTGHTRACTICLRLWARASSPDDLLLFICFLIS